MKITVDLDDMFAGFVGEDGEPDGENIGERIRNEVLERVIGQVIPGLRKSMEERLTGHFKEMVDKELKTAVAAFMGEHIPKLLDYQFTEVDSWGRSNGKSVTVRDRILSEVEKQCKISESSRSYDQNTFTKLIVEKVEEMMREFKKQYDGSVQATFTRDALDYAQKSLKKQLGITV